MPTDAPPQEPCVHCGECVRACPESLDPKDLFFALADDDFDKAQGARLDACSECNRCVDVCPSRIPLLDWFRWGKSEVRRHARADAARQRFLARTARLARERESRAARRREVTTTAALPVQTISRSEVLAAIARGRARRGKRQ